MVTNTKKSEIISRDKRKKLFIIKNCYLKIIPDVFLNKFKNIVTLDLSDNFLTELPLNNYLPVLKELRCSSNKIIEIPFYPNLEVLHVPHNSVKSLTNYHKSNLKYLDCSYNPYINININLPMCHGLYTSNNNLLFIEICRLPKIQLLDCSNNFIETIDQSNSLIELDISSNKFTHLPFFDSLVRLFADNNKIQNLQIYQNLQHLSISNNNLQTLICNDKLEYLNASNNYLIHVSGYNNCEIIDLSYNYLSEFNFCDKMDSIYIHSNNILTTNIETTNLTNVSEIQIDLFFYSLFNDDTINSFESETMTLDSDAFYKQLVIFFPHININNDKLKNIKYVCNNDKLFKIFSKLCNKQDKFQNFLKIYYNNVRVLLIK